MGRTKPWMANFACQEPLQGHRLRSCTFTDKINQALQTQTIIYLPLLSRKRHKCANLGPTCVAGDAAVSTTSTKSGTARVSTIPNTAQIGTLIE